MQFLCQMLLCLLGEWAQNRYSIRCLWKEWTNFLFILQKKQQPFTVLLSKRGSNLAKPWLTKKRVGILKPNLLILSPGPCPRPHTCQPDQIIQVIPKPESNWTHFWKRQSSLRYSVLFAKPSDTWKSHCFFKLAKGKQIKSNKRKQFCWYLFYKGSEKERKLQLT